MSDEITNVMSTPPTLHEVMVDQGHEGPSDEVIALRLANTDLSVKVEKLTKDLEAATKNYQDLLEKAQKIEKESFAKALVYRNQIQAARRANIAILEECAILDEQQYRNDLSANKEWLVADGYIKLPAPPAPSQPGGNGAKTTASQAQA